MQMELFYEKISHLASIIRRLLDFSFLQRNEYCHHMKFSTYLSPTKFSWLVDAIDSDGWSELDGSSEFWRRNKPVELDEWLIDALESDALDIVRRPYRTIFNVLIVMISFWSNLNQTKSFQIHRWEI